jgi:hypothetical protein
MLPLLLPNRCLGWSVTSCSILQKPHSSGYSSWSLCLMSSPNFLRVLYVCGLDCCFDARNSNIRRSSQSQNRSLLFCLQIAHFLISFGWIYSGHKHSLTSSDSHLLLAKIWPLCEPQNLEQFSVTLAILFTCKSQTCGWRTVTLTQLLLLYSEYQYMKVTTRCRTQAM